MDKAKQELIENELDDAKKERLTENLIVSEYFRSEEELLCALEENNHMWERICFVHQDIQCIFKDRPDKAISTYKSFCNLKFDDQSDEEKFWNIAENLSWGYLSTALEVTILILRKLPTLVDLHCKTDINQRNVGG